MNNIKLISACVSFCLIGICAHAQNIDTTAPTDPQIVIPAPGNPDALLSQTDAPQGTAIAFDSMNRPYIINIRKVGEYGKIYTLRNGKWVTYSFLDDLARAGYSSNTNTIKSSTGARSSMVFDNDDALYIIVPQLNNGAANGNMLLLFTPKIGDPFQVYPLNTRFYLTAMESRTNGNAIKSSPAILRGYSTDLKDSLCEKGYLIQNSSKVRDSKIKLTATFANKIDGKLYLSAPVTISENTMGMDVDASVTVNGKTYVAYLERPEIPAQGCNPQYISVIDRNSGIVTNTACVGTVYPEAVDNHCLPTIAADSKGYIHYISGNHGWNKQHAGFFYTHSANPKDIGSWQKPVMMGIAQTYPSIVIDGKDRMTVAFRIHPALCFQNYNPATGLWTAPKTLASCPSKPTTGFYSHFYHRFYVDRLGNRYLQFEFTDNDGGVDHNYPHVFVTSQDYGETWKLATTAIYLKNIIGAPELPTNNNNGQVNGYGDGGSIK
jgi:hypothetical protein